MVNSKKSVSKTQKDVVEGTPVKKIAENYGLSSDLVIKELKKLGIKKKEEDIIEESSLPSVLEHFNNLAKEQSVSKLDTKAPSKTTKKPTTKSSTKTTSKIAKKDVENVVEKEVKKEDKKEIILTHPVTVKSFAEATGKKATEVVMALMKMSILASINQVIDQAAIKALSQLYSVDVVLSKTEQIEPTPIKKEVPQVKHEVVKKSELSKRPPVVTFMGHVDHGKTSIQDSIRKTNVVKGESGGITQHTGASVVLHNNEHIVFIDTPGHEAFTAMRSRGANITDIVVLVVAADDGFMPQTVEALGHAKAAKVPIIVAINKVDLPSADPNKVLLHMQQNGLMSEDWGGDVGTVKVSALTGEGLSDLLDRILLEAEILELKADDKESAQGVVLEASQEQGLGAVANVLITSGTLNIGDIVLCEQHYGRVKLLVDGFGNKVKSIGPSMPAKIVGLSGIPMAGASFSVCKNEKIASESASVKASEVRSKGLTRSSTSSLEDLFKNIKDSQRNDLNLVIKTDVQGTSEAIKDSLTKLPSEKIKVNVVFSAVGAITESDTLLASASGAIIVGFHVKINPGVNDLAKKHNVEIRLYSVIYELIEDIKEALEGRLAPDQRETKLGKAKILKIFEVSKGPKICGCLAEEGTIRVGSKARVYRNKELIFNGQVQSLRRFQNDVKEVKSGQECGIRLDNFLDFQENDLIELYDIEYKKASL